MRLQTRAVIDYPPAMLEQYSSKWVTKQSATRGPRAFKSLRTDISLADYARRFDRDAGLVPTRIPEAWESVFAAKQERRFDRAQTRDLVDLPPKALAKAAAKWVTKQSRASWWNFPGYAEGVTVAEYVRAFEELNHLVRT